jgi:hypothetical protein
MAPAALPVHIPTCSSTSFSSWLRRRNASFRSDFVREARAPLNATAGEVLSDAARFIHFDVRH